MARAKLTDLEIATAAADSQALYDLFGDDAHNRIVDYAHNIIGAYRRATRQQLKDGLTWYNAARTFAVELAETYQLTVEQAVGVLAVMSPGVSWTMQLKYTAAFMTHIQNGGTPSDAPGPFTGENKRKAARIMYGEEPTAVLKGVKVTAFYRNILGDHSGVTVDRHALRVAIGQDLTPDECKPWLRPSCPGRREVVAAYHLAARYLKVDVALGQAVTWVVYRADAGLK